MTTKTKTPKAKKAAKSDDAAPRKAEPRATRPANEPRTYPLQPKVRQAVMTAEIVESDQVGFTDVRIADNTEPPIIAAVNRLFGGFGGKMLKATGLFRLPEGHFEACREFAEQGLGLLKYDPPVEEVEKGETTKAMLRSVSDWLGSFAGKTVLEPSCGTGNLIQAALDAGAAHVVGIELDAEVADRARERFADDPRVTIATGDFLKLGKRGKLTFEAVLMNPPYVGKKPVKHALAAITRHLDDGGELVAFLPDVYFGAEAGPALTLGSVLQHSRAEDDEWYRVLAVDVTGAAKRDCIAVHYVHNSAAVEAIQAVTEADPVTVGSETPVDAPGTPWADDEDAHTEEEEADTDAPDAVVAYTEEGAEVFEDKAGRTYVLDGAGARQYVEIEQETASA